MRAFVRFRNEVWYLDLAYNDKLAKDNNGVKCLLVRQDLFDRIIDARGTQTKESKETVKTCSKVITRKNTPKKICEGQRTEFAGEFGKFCSAEKIEVFSRMSETKAAFAERTIRSLKNNLYRNMEDYGYKYYHKIPQFVATMNSRNNHSLDMRPNRVRNSDFMSKIYSKHLREYKKPKFGIEDTVRSSKFDIPFRKGNKPQFTQEIFENVAIATLKTATITIKDEQEEVIRGEFYEKERIRVI